MLAETLDRLIAFAAADEPELVAAREEWAERAGKVFDDDALYEERTTAFLEWFALERPSPDGRVPAARFAESARADEAHARWARALGRSHRSLFRVEEKGADPGAILVEDLLGGGAFLVTERRRLTGIEPGEIFEARLVADVDAPPQVLFTRGFQFHPREAQPELERHAARARAAGEARVETLFRLLRLRLKALRYRHVAADKIYAAADAGA
jgi:hypothetical protein